MRRMIAPVVACATVLVAASPAAATFPGDNGSIAFRSNGAVTTDIGVVQPDGSGITVFPTSHRYEFEPSWSPDGSKILFDSELAGRRPDAKLKTSAPDGSGVTTIFEAPRRIRYMIRPVWSPDGSQIAFCGALRRTFADRIFTVNADGTSLTNVSGDTDDCHPDWSPDGSTIAFATGRGAIKTMNVDGSGRTTVASGEWPSWSPDGSMIAYVRNLNIFVADADGSNEVKLTDTRKRFEYEPAFSPDGTLVAFTRAHGSGADLFTIALGDLTVTRLTDTRRSEASPAWQPVP